MKLEELKSLLKKHNLWAKKRLGQNFLIDEKVFDRILEAADLKSSDVVAEVGPGTGFLTERLISAVKQVVAVEKDADMVRVLEDRFCNVKNLELIHADILKLKIQDLSARQAEAGQSPRRTSGKQSYKVVANIPYYITSPLLKHFLRPVNRPELIVILVQKEVAEKICGITGKSLITIETQLFGRPEIVGYVPAKSFYPAPKVESAILKIEVFDEPLISEEELADFLRVVKFGFSQKRKKLKSSLAAGLHKKPSEVAEILKQAGIDPNLRAENLEIGDWERLIKGLTKLDK